MNLKFPFSNRQSPIELKSVRSAVFARHSRSGIALIITLILLSVTLIMAVAFLAISRRERASVTTTTDAANSRLAADAALSSAEAQIVANALSGGTNAFGYAAPNPFKFGLMVSTNYINWNGFNTTEKTNDPANVNYDYYTTANGPLSLPDFLQNLANLYYLPRPPVYIPVNGTNYDFRFYLDLNQNGRYDTNGFVTNVDNNLNDLGTASIQVGDPEWIGLLEHPGEPYGPNNKFIARFAFIAVPIGNALDLNAIHNQIRDEPLTTAISSSQINPGANTADGFFRNQGVGTWELNLAAFLTDLNTDEWDNANSGAGIYQYNEANPPLLSDPEGASANSGAAFDDSRALLAYRYNNNYFTLNSAGNLFTPPNYFNFFVNGSVDGYSDLNLQTNFDTNYTIFVQNTTWPWAGADNTNLFFDQPSDLFDTTKTTTGVLPIYIVNSNDFSARLLDAGTNNSTYDRYTFYRLLSQLGTDSSPETGLMNLNYDNLDPYPTNGFDYPASETNFMPWTPLGFFTNAANRMLQMYTGMWATNYATNLSGVFTGYLNTNFVMTFNMTNAFGIANIPVLVSNQFCYTPAVNRLLQLAANLYDATSTNYYPSVFRPMFLVTNQNGFYNVFISGYTNFVTITNTTPTQDAQLDPPVDIATLLNTPSVINVPNVLTNVYGVPWIIGVKKGFPTFNEFVGENIVGVTRRLQLIHDATTAVGTNQMYMLSLNTSAGLDFWNSYRTNFPDNVTVSYRVASFLSLTNSDANGPLETAPSTPPFSVGFFVANSITFSNWPGTGPAPWSGGEPNTNSFVIPLNFVAFADLSNSVYRTPNASVAAGTLPSGFTPPALVGTNYFNNQGDSMTSVFETNLPHGYLYGQSFYVPQWGLLTTDQLQVYTLDQDASGNYHVIDYVHLEQAGSQNINSQIFTDDNNGIWNTNINAKYGIPWGIQNQISISRGLQGITGVPGEDGYWQGDPESATYSSSVAVQQADFNAFFYPYGTVVPDNSGIYGSNYEAAVDVPYAPTRFAVGYTVMQANDPLVHYLASDLTPSFQMNVLSHYDNSISNVPPPAGQPFTLGQLNYNFQPWGGNPYAAANGSGVTFPETAPNAYDLSERDPLAEVSDNWDFPTNKLPTVGWIGRVHRGTPWQTVYLKSPDILQEVLPIGNTVNYGPNIWAQWTGDQETTGPLEANGTQYFDAMNSAPREDRLLFDLFTTGINDNATRGQLSVNQGADQYDPVANPDAGLAAWSAVLSGVVVPAISTTNSYYTINPAGTNGITSALANFVTNINYTRYTFTNLDGLVGTFEHRGDILTAPALSYQSPFLNLTQTNWNNDEMYEWVPQQIMSLVRRQSTPRYVVYCYGQTLKPAPNGIYTGSASVDNGQEPAFGMVTNYQITAESGTRAVIRIDGLTDANGRILPPGQQHPHAVIESFNVLPPD